MPSKAPTPCTYPLCPRVSVSHGRCAQHPSIYAHNSPNRWANGAPGRPMPPGWQATRNRILNRDHHTCTMCGAEATQVDHVIRNGGEHDANLQSLCDWCHKWKTQREAAEARAIAIAKAKAISQWQ